MDEKSKPDSPAEQIYFSYRLLVYAGSKDWIQRTLIKRAVNGRFVLPNGASIAELFLTEYPLVSQKAEPSDGGTS